MRIASDPRLLALLAASYELGTLRGAARRRFEALAREHAVVRASALLWRERLASLVELGPAVDVPPAVWARIRQQIEAELSGRSTPSPTPVRTARGRVRLWDSLSLWRTLAAIGSCAALALGLALDLAFKPSATAPGAAIQYISVLTDAQGAPSLLVTTNPATHQLVLQRLGTYREAWDRSLQLWALPPGASPRSLGVLSATGVGARLAADATVLGVAPALAVSLEPRGGVPGDRGPTGPVLFKGPLIEKIF